MLLEVSLAVCALDREYSLPDVNAKFPFCGQFCDPKYADYRRLSLQPPKLIGDKQVWTKTFPGQLQRRYHICRWKYDRNEIVGMGFDFSVGRWRGYIGQLAIQVGN